MRRNGYMCMYIGINVYWRNCIYVHRCLSTKLYSYICLYEREYMYICINIWIYGHMAICVWRVFCIYVWIPSLLIVFCGRSDASFHFQSLLIVANALPASTACTSTLSRCWFVQEKTVDFKYAFLQVILHYTCCASDLLYGSALMQYWSKREYEIYQPIDPDTPANKFI